MNPEQTRYPEDTPRTNAVLQSEKYDELCFDALEDISKELERECALLSELCEKLRDLLETVACSLEFIGHKASADKIRADVEALNAPKQ